jgi:hypothetical protein
MTFSRGKKSVYEGLSLALCSRRRRGLAGLHYVPRGGRSVQEYARVRVVQVQLRVAAAVSQAMRTSSDEGEEKNAGRDCTGRGVSMNTF